MTPQFGQWTPIEHAPKRTDIIKEPSVRLLLLTKSGRIVIGRYSPEQFAAKPRPYWILEGYYGVCEMRRDQPTHFMPLPGNNPD
jgi:hypothetical protein